MGRVPCCDKANVKRGPWSPEEDAKLKSYIEQHGTGGNWIALPQKIGLKRCGKSCRLRWLNYLRPNIKHGGFSEEEDTIICCLYMSIGSRWSIIAAQLPGRTDNDIKNYWNTRLKKKLLGKQWKEQQARTGGLKQQGKRGGNPYPMVSADNNNQNPHWPELPTKVEGRFSDDDRPILISMNPPFPNYMSFTQQLYDQSINVSSMEAVNNSGTQSSTPTQYNTDEIGLQRLQGQRSFPDGLEFLLGEDAVNSRIARSHGECLVGCLDEVINSLVYPLGASDSEGTKLRSLQDYAF